MIDDDVFAVEPWVVRERDARPRHARADRVGLRALQRPHRPARQPRRGRAATACPGPTSTASTRCARCPTPRPATATRRPARRVVNVTNGKLIRLLVDDEPFDVRYGELRRTTSACSTCATGVLRREVEWRSPAGGAVRVRSTRLVSFAQRAVAAIRYEVEPLDGDAADRRAVRAGRQRAASRCRATTRAPRPRCAAPLVAEDHGHHELARRCSCTARARSGLRMAAAMDHVVDGPDGTVTAAESERRPRARDGHRRARSPARRCAIVKFLAYGWSSQRSVPSLRDQVDAALAVGARAPAGTACSTTSASTSTTSGRAPTSSSRATPSSSRRCASRSSTRCRPARAPSSGRSPPRA